MLRKFATTAGLGSNRRRGPPPVPVYRGAPHTRVSLVCPPPVIVSAISFGTNQADSSVRVTVCFFFPTLLPLGFPNLTGIMTQDRSAYKARPTISSRCLAGVHSIAQALSVKVRWSGSRRNGHQRRFSQLREKCQWSPVANEPRASGRGIAQLRLAYIRDRGGPRFRHPLVVFCVSYELFGAYTHLRLSCT